MFRSKQLGIHGTHGIHSGRWFYRAIEGMRGQFVREHDGRELWLRRDFFFLEHFHFTLIISTSDTWMQVLPLWNSESFRGCETSGLLFEKLFRVFVALTPENEK